MGTRGRKEGTVQGAGRWEGGGQASPASGRGLRGLGLAVQALNQTSSWCIGKEWDPSGPARVHGDF